MLFSRIDARPNARRILIDSTEIGMEAATVSPARRPTYTVTAPKMMPKIDPSTSARTVNSGGCWSGGTNDWNSAKGASCIFESKLPENLKHEFKASTPSCNTAHITPAMDFRAHSVVPLLRSSNGSPPSHAHRYAASLHRLHRNEQIPNSRRARLLALPAQRHRLPRPHQHLHRRATDQPRVRAR